MAVAEPKSCVFVITNQIGKSETDIFRARDYQEKAYGEFIEFEKRHPNKTYTFVAGEGSIKMDLLRDPITGFVKYIRTDNTFAYMITNMSLQIVTNSLQPSLQLSSLQINCLIEFMKMRHMNVAQNHSFYTNYKLKNGSPDALCINNKRIANVKTSGSRRNNPYSADNVFVVFFYQNGEYYIMTYTEENIPKPNRVYKILMDKQVEQYMDAVKSHNFANSEFNILNCKEIPCSEAPEDSKSACSICFSNFKNVILNPCNHIDMCSECVSKNMSNKCGICRTNINSVSPLVPKSSMKLKGNISLDALSIIEDENNVQQKQNKILEEKIKALQNEFNPEQFPEIIAFGKKVLSENLGLEIENASASG
jgi:hypothetical protein